jgi:hypothetical protein
MERDGLEGSGMASYGEVGRGRALKVAARALDLKSEVAREKEGKKEEYRPL